MASPPFNINQALPGDSDIVSQHPSNARTFRDVVESWLLVNHDTNGNHFRVDIPRTATPTAPAANIDVLYVTTTGRLKIKHPDGTEEFVGTPPGHVEYTAGAVAVGWLFADGTAVSRTTYADLFGIIGTTYGAGDGSTTFNLPNLIGRTIYGIDASGLRLTTAGGGIDGATMGAVGGIQNVLLGVAHIPTLTSVNAAQAISVTAATKVLNSASGAIVDFNPPISSFARALDNTAVATNVTSSGNNSISVTYTNASQIVTKTVSPGIILRPVIKT